MTHTKMYYMATRCATIWCAPSFHLPEIIISIYFHGYQIHTLFLRDKFRSFTPLRTSSEISLQQYVACNIILYYTPPYNWILYNTAINLTNTRHQQHKRISQTPQQQHDYYNNLFNNNSSNIKATITTPSVTMLLVQLQILLTSLCCHTLREWCAAHDAQYYQSRTPKVLLVARFSPELCTNQEIQSTKGHNRHTDKFKQIEIKVDR